MVKRFLDVLAVAFGVIGALAFLLAGDWYRHSEPQMALQWALIGGVILLFAYAARYIAHGGIRSLED